MSGVFGVVDPQHRVDGAQLVERMETRLKHCDWYRAESYVDRVRNVGVGRIGIEIFNPQEQPAWSIDRSRAVFLAGELYAVEGVEFQGANVADENRILTLYERRGLDFPRYLNGAFVCAILDWQRQHLIIANDRFGLYPLYYTTRNDRLVFAPEVKGVLCDSGFKRELDLTALAQYMRFQHLLGQRTFFEDLRLLPPGTVLVCDLQTAGCAVQAYWSFADLPYCPNVGFEEAVAQTGQLLRRAVHRLSGDHYRPGVYLSGGLDSRIILGLAERRPIASLTYGAKNSRDVFYAAQIARVIGSEHHWLDLPDGRWVQEYVDFHLELTEGFHSWIHAHGISTLAQARQWMDVNLSGWDGGTVMGHLDSIEPLQMSAVDENALTLRLFALFNQSYTWPGLTEAEAELLYSPCLRKEIRGLAFDSFREELGRYWALRPDVRGELFYFHNHCSRLTQNMITFARSHIEVRFPFLDYALFEFLYSLPAPVRGHRVLYHAVLQRETPTLARIPYDHDEFLPTSRRWLREIHALKVKVGRRAQRYLKLFPPRPTLYADYETYLRHELRPWAEGILFDRRTTERGLFDPRFLRTLMARHVSGLEQWTIGKIAPVVTYEMMLRRLYD
jgi:asparagine synthase (glutamine-hydrolysing)